MVIKKNIGLLFSLIAVLIVSVIPIFTLHKRGFICKDCGGSYSFAFNLDIVSKNNKDEIEVVGARGKNTNNLSIRLVDNIGKCKKGNNIKTILCECETDKQYTRIDSLKLRINGKEKEINLKFPIENSTMNNVININ